jgi:hypothetical protein
MLDGGEIGGRVIGADAAFVVAEIHIHNPVKAILNHPMASDSRPELGGNPQQWGNAASFPARNFPQRFAHVKVVLLPGKFQENRRFLSFGGEKYLSSKILDRSSGSYWGRPIDVFF